MLYLASAGGDLNSLGHAFLVLGHDIKKIAGVSIVVIYIIGVLLHFVFTRRAGAFSIHHYLGVLILGVGLTVVWPWAGREFSHLNAGGRGGFDALIICIAFSDIIIQVLGRIVGRLGGGGGE